MSSLTNLLLNIGDDHTTVLPLDHSFAGFKARKGYNEVTFATSEDLDSGSVLMGNPRMQKQALIVWLDREHVKQALGSVHTGALVKTDEVQALRNLMYSLRDLNRLGVLDRQVQMLSSAPQMKHDLAILEAFFQEPEPTHRKPKADS